MKKILFLGYLCMLFYTFGCSDETAKGQQTSCGDGILNNGEICDGSVFAEHVKVCPEGLVLRDESAFSCTATCGLDFSRACAAPSCGDGVLSGGEVCDGNFFKESAKFCPHGMHELPNPHFKCTEICMIDYTNACTSDGAICGDDKLNDAEVCDGELFQSDAKQCPSNMVELENPVFGCTDKCQLDFTNACISSICGDGRVTGSETCDGNLFADEARICPMGQKPLTDRDLFVCNTCMLDTSKACIPVDAKAPTLYFSEIDILRETDQTKATHLYIEVGNLGADTVLDDCRLVGVSLEDGNTISDTFIFEYDLSQVDDRLGNTANDPTNILGICYEPIEGWLKTQFKEDSLTVQECDIYYNGARMAYKSCSSYCSDAGNDDSNCIAACINIFDIAGTEYANCLATASYVQLDSACNFYIPPEETSIFSVIDNTNQNPHNLWGIALICGNTIHDMIGLKDISIGGERMCTENKDLSTITATGNAIVESGYQSCDNNGILSKQPHKTYGYARCGYCTAN